MNAEDVRGINFVTFLRELTQRFALQKLQRQLNEKQLQAFEKLATFTVDGFVNTSSNLV